VPPSPAWLPALGAVFASRYRILEKIGTGRLGEVFRAHDSQTQTTVAIKFLRASNTRALEQATRHFEGAVAASQIRHPHIVEVHETGLSEYGPYLVMEDLQGEHVGRILERLGRLKRESCFALMEPVLLALAAAHSVDLLHGDVKPENIILCQLPDKRATIKLLDFGAVLTTSSNPGLAELSPYLAPEQIAGRPIDHRADIFSTALVLYELLTNAQPFHGPTQSATAYRVANLACPSLAQMGLPRSESLSTVLERALHKDPSARYGNARELLEALRPLMKSELPTMALLPELLPLSTLLSQDSGIMPASSASRQPVRISSNPIPESGSRLAGSAVRPSSIPTSYRVDSARPPSTPRPSDSIDPVLPPRYRGRYRARAIVWQSLDEYVRARRPAHLRERVLYDIGTEAAGDLLLGTLQGIMYCDLESITQYIELTTARLFTDGHAWCRAAGRDAVDGALSTALVRSIPPSPTVESTLRRVGRIFGPLFDFGHWQLETRENSSHIVVTISELDAACQGLRLWMAGLVERSLATAHYGVSLVIARGEGSFMPRMVLEVHGDTKT
jgi:serine/threonine protein kinase